MDQSGDIQLKSDGEHDDPSHLTASPAVDIPDKMYSTDSDLSDWEIRQFGRHKITSPPLIHKSQPSDDEDHMPPGSPGKRSYKKTFDTLSFEAAAENVQLSPNKKKHKEQVWTPGKENQGRMPKNWNNSVSSRDSALGSSLFSAFGSVLTDSSTSFDSQSNSDDTTSSVSSSPVHSVYGRYQKIYTNDKGKNTDDKALREYENLLLHRLPGENLGMILGIEGGKFNETISGVFVKTVTIGGAAYRATGSSKGIAVGDEILEVNGMDLKEMNREECMTVLKEMPLRVNLMLRRGSKFSGPTSSDGVSHFRQKMKEVSSKVCKNQRFMQNYAMTTTTSESEDDLLEGFALHHVEVDKNPDESLGISVVPSYGSTREFYQVKRLLPSGAAARSTKLKVGDRLVSCNGVSLRNLTQAKCLSILKTEAQHGDLELEVLRQAENDTPMEISVIVANGVGSKESKVSSSSKEQEIYPNSGLESESDNDVVLSGFHFNRDKNNSDSVHQVFAQNVKLQNRAPTRHPPQRQPSESNVSDQDSDYSLKSQHQKLVNAKMASNSSDPWSLALPPPAEFSDEAGLTSEGGASDTGDELVPTTNIDDILSDYAPSISGPASPRIESVKRDLQLGDVSSGLDRLQERKRVNSLTQIRESPQELELDFSTQNGIENKPSQVEKPTNCDRALLDVPDRSMNSCGYDTLKEQRRVMDVFDSYLTSEDDSIASYKPSDGAGSHSNVSISPQPSPSHQVRAGSPCNSGNNANSLYEVTNVIHGDTKGGKNVLIELNDNESIVPVQVKREMSTPPNWAKYSLSSSIPASVFDLPESSVDEGVIIPASIQREKKAPIYEIPTPHLHVSPPREKIPSRPKPQPRKSKSSESEESMEEMVSPVHIKKEQGSRVLVEKLGTDIEENLIVPEEAKRENSWNSVQLALMTNKWAKASNVSTGQTSEGGLFNVLSNIKSDKKESTAETCGVIVRSVNQVTVTSVNNEQRSGPVSGENIGVTVTPVVNEQRSGPVSGENIVNISVENVQDWQCSEENSSVTEHMITPRIEEFADEKDDEKVSITVVDDKANRGLSDRNQTEVPPTHKTVVCVSEHSNVKNVVSIDPSQPLAHENTVTLENAVLMDTDIGEGLLPRRVSDSSTSPVVSPSASPRSPVIKSRNNTSPFRSPSSPVARSPVPRSRSPVPRSRSPVPRSRQDVSPNRKSPSLSPRAVSPGVTMDPVKESEPSTTVISAVNAPVVSPRSSVSVLSPASISPRASHASEGVEQVKPVKKTDSLGESVLKQPTKYTTSVAVTKPSLLSTIRSQTTSGQMKPLSSIKPLKINTNFQPKPVKYSTTINTKPSLLSTLHGSALSTTSMADAKSSRSEDQPFQVNVLKGILGLGMKVKVTAEGHTQVTEVQSTGPIAKDKNIRTGDYLLAINNTELTGLQDSKVQQILRLLPRGLAKLIASATPPGGDHGSSDTRKDSKELTIKPEVLDIDRTKSTQQVPPEVSPSPLILVKPSGPKVTPRAVVTPPEPTKHISPTSPGRLVTDTVEPTVSNKLQSTIITNSHEHQNPEVPKPAPREARMISEPAVRREPPPIAPKPRLDKKPEPIATSRPPMQSGGYVGSAAGKVKAYERSSVTEVGSSYSAPSSSSYASSAKKSVTPTEKTKKDPTEPIDTVIFASIGGRTSPPNSGRDDQEPRLIPSGHVDYVSSTKPRSPHDHSSPWQNQTGPISPQSPTEKDAVKVSPRKVNAALSPRKNKEPSQFNLFTKSSPIAAPATEFLRPTLPRHPGKSDESDTRAPDIDVVTPHSAPNVQSSPSLSVEADIVDVVNKAHVISHNLSNVDSENTVSVVDVLHVSADHSLPDVNKQDSDIDEKPVVRDEISQEVICTVARMPDSVGTSEGKTWPVLDASVEVLHEDDATKPFLSDSSLPNNIKDDIFDQTDCVIELPPPDGDSDSEDATPPLPPQSTMPGALSIAADMLDDILSEVGEEGVPVNLPSHHLPAVPTTIAKEMLRDQEFVNQHSRDLTEDTSEDIPLLPPSIPPSLPPSLPPSIPPPFPSTISPMDATELTESLVDDIGEVVPDSGGCFGGVTEDGISVGGPLVNGLDVYTNANHRVIDDVSPADCMSESNDLLLCGVTPSPNACPNVVLDPQPQTHEGRMLTDPHSLVDSTYDSVFFQQDSPGSQGHPGDQNDLEKSSDCFSGGIVNSEGDFVGENGNPVHNDTVNLYALDNTLDSADIAFCIDDAESQSRGDNPDCQENYHDSSRDTYDDQSNLLSSGHQIRNREDVKSRRRWSVVTGPQELNTAYVRMSASSDVSLDESIISSENLAILLDSANNVMDQTGLSLDDEIVVIILHRHDPMMTIGVRLTVGQHQEAVVSSVDCESLAGRDGRIVCGDVLLSANGESLTADQMDDVMNRLNKTTASHIVLVVSKSDMLNPSVSMDTDHPYEQVVPNPGMEVQDDAVPDFGNVDQTDNKLMDVKVIDRRSEVSVIDSPPEVAVIDSPPEVAVIDSPPEVAVIDSPPEVTVIDSPPEVAVIDSPPEVATSPPVPVIPDVVKHSVGKVQPDVIAYEMPVFDDPVDDGDKEEFNVVMTKGVTGLGFLIEGGKASPRGDMPLTIRRILKSGPAEKCGQLKVKDEIREINGEDITDMRHSEAWQHLKFLDDGEVRLKIWRQKVH